MPDARCLSDGSDRTKFDIPNVSDHLSDQGTSLLGAAELNPIARALSPSVVDRCFGALVDIPANAWLFV